MVPVTTSPKARLRAVVLAMTLAGAMVPAAEGAGRSDRQRGDLPLGRPGLEESRSVREVAPGVTYTLIVRGEPSRRDAYAVDVGFRAERREARELAARLRDDGYRPQVVRVAERAPDDPARGPLGYLVRVGSLSSEAQGQALRDRLAANGYGGLRVVYEPEDGGRTSGPWVVHALELDPSRLTGRLDARLATDVVPGRELLTALAGRDGAVAALNGGYFVVGPADGTPGDLAGISLLDGAPVSEAVNGRTSLLVPGPRGAGARVAALSTTLAVTAPGGARREVDGLNRKPGLIRGCGGVGGDLPTERPKHDFTCTDSSELIRFTPAFGAASEPGAGAEAVLDTDGRVLELRAARGGSIPADGSLLSGTGEAAEWLLAHARPGAALALAGGVLADGAPLAARPALDVVNGGPRLLRAGRLEITAAAEGFHWPENPEFYYRFGTRRHPRTLAGVTRGGRVILVAVDGRRPGWSVGASFEESALIMRALGARDAPVFDGPEDRNGLRNADEIRFWADYVTPGRAGYIYDDRGRSGGLHPSRPFVIAGDQNADPLDGDSLRGPGGEPIAIQQLLESPRVNPRRAPASAGGPEAAALQGGANATHEGDPAFDTADFADGAPGNLRTDYVLPRRNIRIARSGVFWPVRSDPLSRLTGSFDFSAWGPVGGFPTSDHRLVWADLDLPGVR